MGKPSAEQVAQRAFDLGLLDQRQLQEIWAAHGTRNVTTDDFLTHLVRREYMTNYQVERLTRGERGGFFFGEYKVLYLVGAGTFARVYRAVHTKTGEVVALKVLRRRFSENATQSGRFVREGRVVKSLQHEHIVPIHEVYSKDKVHFLVMDFIEGRNLRDFVKIRQTLSPMEATKLMIDIVDGLAHAFEQGLTHRDLKMSNILVSSDGSAKLVDFGLASLDETLNEADLADVPNARSIDYAALERSTGVKKDDTRSDIYFLGSIFYNMLSGETPLAESRDRMQRLSRQRFLDVQPIRTVMPDLPDSVVLVVNKAMMLDPSKRYQTPAAMLADLQIAIRRIDGEIAAAEEAKKNQPEAEAPPKATIMIVEPNTQLQDVFRKGFRLAGYRVLITSDPTRALERFRGDASTADCVIINAQNLGRGAIDVFNQFGGDPKTDFIRVGVLLDEQQKEWQGLAKGADHRVVIQMPLTMKQLRQKINELLAVSPGR